MDNIIPLWQPVGYSTHIITKKVAEKIGVKTSHTGTLDPMAEGVIVILSGEHRHKKYEYAGWLKEYEFEIVFGIATDSYDGLGLIQKLDSVVVRKEALSEVLQNFVGEYSQSVPPYSAIKVKGKPLHWYARNNTINSIDVPTRSGRIHNIKLVDFNVSPLKEISAEIINKVSKVTGNLRQKEVTSTWTNLENQNEQYYTSTIRVTMTRGLYVRSLCVDICKELNTHGFVKTLTRTKNGDYSKENSQTLTQFFGDGYLEKYNFVSKLANQ